MRHVTDSVKKVQLHFPIIRRWFFLTPDPKLSKVQEIFFRRLQKGDDWDWESDRPHQDVYWAGKCSWKYETGL